MTEVLNNNTAENPDAVQWKNMDVKAQAQEKSPAETPSETGETTSVPSDENVGESGAPQIGSETINEPSETTNKETAQEWWIRTKYGEPKSPEAPKDEKENQSVDDNELTEASEIRRAEAAQERRDLNHEQTKSEERLAAYEKRLKEIEGELEKASGDKAEFENILEVTDGLLEENFKQHEVLSTKAESLELEVKKTKRSILSKIAKWTKAMVKAAVNQEFHQIEAVGIDMRLDSQKGEAAKQSLKETKEELDANEAEGEELNNSREDTLDQIKFINNKTARLNSEKAKLEKQAEELKEMVYNEGFEEAIVDATGGKGVKGAIRGERRTIRGHERNIDRIEDEKESINEYYDEEIEEAKADVLKGMKKLETLGGPQAEKANDEGLPEEIKNLLNRAEQNRTEQIDRKDAEINEEEKGIDAALDRINLIEGLRETESTKSALLRLKNKIMKRIRGL